MTVSGAVGDELAAVVRLGLHVHPAPALDLGQGGPPAAGAGAEADAGGEGPAGQPGREESGSSADQQYHAG